jgi:AraC-like DNA-binding protein
MPGSTSSTENEWVVASPIVVLGKVAHRYNLDWENTLTAHGLSPDECTDPDAHLAIRPTLALFASLSTRLNDDAVVFDIFDQAPVGFGSVFDYVFLCSASLSEGLFNWARFYPTRSNCINILYDETPEQGIIEFSISDHFGPQAQITYAFMAYLAGRIERAIDDPPISFVIEISAKRPRQTSSFQERYGERLRFDAASNRILIARQDLQRVPSNADPSLFRIVEGAALRELAGLTESTSQISVITAKISQALRTGDCSMEYVASSLGMSNRSLQRALENEGTSYRKVLDNVRRSIAERYLVDTDRPVKEIAFLLGFSEVSAFSRAVRNWFGASPRALRQGAHSPSASQSALR